MKLWKCNGEKVWKCDPPWFNPARHGSGSKGFPTHPSTMPPKQLRKSWKFYMIFLLWNILFRHKGWVGLDTETGAVFVKSATEILLSSIVRIQTNTKPAKQLTNITLLSDFQPLIQRLDCHCNASACEWKFLSQRFHPKAACQDEECTRETAIVSIELSLF